MPRLTDDQKQLLSLLPDDGAAIGGYTLIAQLQDAGWRTREIERTMAELRELGMIIVGRGGNGGSIRHVKKDRRALLDALGEFEAEGSKGTRQSLQQYMRWHPDYLEQVLEALLEAGKIHIGPGGGGGVITLVDQDDEEEVDDADEQARVVDDPADDERRLLELVPQTGSISNSRLRQELSKRSGWDDERYWETRKRLRQKGLIEIGGGRGGSVRRVSIDAVVSTGEVPKEPEQAEPGAAHDEDVVWQSLPESGDPVELSGLQMRLGWGPDRFFGTLERLSTSHRIHWSNSKAKRLVPAPPPAVDPQPVAPPPPRASIDPTGALYGFLRERFDASSLERFLEFHLRAQTISQGIAWNSELGACPASC